MAGDRGSVTVELAAGLPALIVLLLAGLTAVMAVVSQLRCVDAAREAARAQARGGSGVLAGQRVAPGATIVVSEDGDVTRARVTVQVRPLGERLPSFTVFAEAVAADEPDDQP